MATDVSAQVPRTVFYSWQSDLPRESNHDLIRDCLDRAVDQINEELEELSIFEAERGELKTEDGVSGEPGTPDVANKIFERIDKCAVFVADITPIGETPKRRPPNPNVIIEYGFAERAVTDRRILTVFNEAFGDWLKDRPFDLRHKRAPITYWLAETHSEKERTSAEKGLTKILKKAIKDIIEAAPQYSSEPAQETHEQKVARIAAELEFEEQKREFSRSPEGVKASNRAFENLAGLVQSKADELNNRHPGMQLNAQMCDRYLVISGRRRFVVTGWDRKFANSLCEAALITKIHDGMPQIPGYRQFHERPKTLHGVGFAFGLIAPETEGYTEFDENDGSPVGPPFTLDALAEHLIELWLDAVSEVES